MKKIAYLFAVFISFALVWSLTSCEQKEDEGTKKTTTNTNKPNNGGGTNNSGQNNNGQSGTQTDDPNDPNGASHNRTQDDDFTVEIPYEKDEDIATPLTFVALEDGVSISLEGTQEQLDKLNFQYQITKRSGTAGARLFLKNVSEKITLSKGDKVELYGTNAQGINKLSNYMKFAIEGSAAAYGNIMSIIKAEGFNEVTEIPNEYCFAHLFEGCATLVTPPMLPAKTLKPSCYRDMFAKCYALTDAPKIRATKLDEYCCFEMFADCKALTSVEDFPDVANADFCYNSMFKGCTSLATAPALPSTKLAKACYSNMFKNCTAMELAPELPAVILEESCYARMFEGCTELQYVVLGAVDWCADKQATDFWLSNVAREGNFYCPDNLEIKNGASAIPNGWSITYTGTADDPRPVIVSMKLQDKEHVYEGDEYTLAVTANMDCDITVTIGDKVIGTSEGKGSFTVKLPTNEAKKYYVKVSVSKGDLKGKDAELDYLVEKLQLVLHHELSDNSASLLAGSFLTAQIATNIAADVEVRIDGVLASNLKPAGQNLYSITLPTDKKGIHTVIISAKSGDLVADDIRFSYTIRMPKPVLSYRLSKASGIYQDDVLTLTVSSDIACNITVKMAGSDSPLKRGKDGFSVNLPTRLAGNYDVVISGASEDEEADDVTFSYKVIGITPVLTYRMLSQKPYYEGGDYYVKVNANTICDMTFKIDDVAVESVKDATEWTIKLPSASEGKYKACISGKNGSLMAADIVFEYDVEKLIIPEIEFFIKSEKEIYPGDEVALDIISSAECDMQIYVDGKLIDNTYNAETYTTALPTQKPGTYKGVIKSVANGVKGDDVSFSYVVLEPFDDGIDYLCFTAVVGGSKVQLYRYSNSDKTRSNLDNIEYSLDKMRWKKYGNDCPVITLPTTGSKVYFRGKKGVVLDLEGNRFWMSGKINASGSVMSLIDEKCEMDLIPIAGSFAYLFCDCTNLLTPPKLPATTLERRCYSHMFEGCYNLTTAPELPATELYDQCYEYMFSGCKKLKRTPDLPAETLVSGCYRFMFDGCTSLNYVSHNISAWLSGATDYWLRNTAPSGTYVISPKLTNYSVQDGWTVQVRKE